MRAGIQTAPNFFHRSVSCSRASIELLERLAQPIRHRTATLTAKNRGTATSKTMAAQTQSLARVDALLKELWVLRDAFFAADPQVKAAVVETKIREILELIPQGTAKARAAYLRGRALDAGDAYSAEANTSLEKAVKLAPDLVEAWAALGHCLWKKPDLRAAKDCYERSVEKRPTPEALRGLSVLSRRHDPSKATPEQDQQQHDTSILHARAACKLDSEDGESWYTLGNAHIRRYFSQGQGGRKSVDLLMAAKVYEKAEVLYDRATRPATSLEGSWGNPDLCFNRGLIRRHVEDYGGAVKDFRAAHALDRSLNAHDEAEDLERWCRRVADLSERNAALKPKARQKLEEKILAREPPGYTHTALAALTVTKATSDAEHFNSSPNAGASLALVVALELRRGAAGAPDAFLCFAGDGDACSCVALSVYDVDCKRLVPGAVLTALDPVVVDVGTDIGYRTVQTVAPRLLLDGQPLPRVLNSWASSEGRN